MSTETTTSRNGVRTKIRLVRDRIKTLWLIVGVSLIICLMIETGFYLALKFGLRAVPSLDADFMAQADT